MSSINQLKNIFTLKVEAVEPVAAPETGPIGDGWNIEPQQQQLQLQQQQHLQQNHLDEKIYNEFNGYEHIIDWDPIT